MGTPTRSSRNLGSILELFKSGSRMPVKAMERLIGADRRVEGYLIDILRSRAVEEESWAALWALVVLGERRCERALPDMLSCANRGSEVLRQGVEFAILRMGPRAERAVLRHLRQHAEADGRLHLMALPAHLHTEGAVNFLLDQFRPESRDFIAIAWLLAETGHPRAIQALEAAIREYPAEPGLSEPVLALQRGDDLANPLLGDWRQLWTFDQEAAPEEEEEPPPTDLTAPPAEGCEFPTRWFDVDCPVCRSRIEYDSHTGESSVVDRKEAPCPCGSGRKFKECCGRKAPPGA